MSSKCKFNQKEKQLICFMKIIRKDIVSNWQFGLKNRREGKTENFTAYFEAVRGGRVLHFQKQGSAITYTLFKTQS